MCASLVQMLHICPPNLKMTGNFITIQEVRNCKKTAFSLWCDTTIAMVRESAQSLLGSI